MQRDCNVSTYLRFLAVRCRSLAQRSGFALLLVLLAGCVVNPVTGKRELGLVSFEQQIAMGKQHYGPSQQMQGGRYTVDPGLTEYVNRVGQRVAAASEVPLPYEFVVLNNSVPNAWALPGGKIAINRGLVTELRNEAELAAVLGHEAAHAAARHGARAMERGMLLQGAMVAAMIGARNTDYAQTVLGAAQMAAGLLTLRYGRDAEREADFYGTEFMARAGYDPYAAVSLQETFVRLSEESGRSKKQNGWLEGLFASHPPSTERVANNKSIVGRLREQYPQAKEYGADRFAASLRTLRRDAPAYAAYDEARKALKDDDLNTALRQVQVALRGQQREPAFHNLRGDIRLKQKRYGDAQTNYERAINLRDGFFGPYVGRGLARKAQRQYAPARADLTRSVELLPTAVAYNALGELAEQSGDADEAVRYYQAASQAQGEAGRTALGNLLRLDVPRQPARYVQARIVQDNQARLVLQVVNTTPVDMRNVVIQVELLGADGRAQRFTSRVRSLQAKKTLQQLIPDTGSAISDGRAYAVAAQPAS
ncbi:MAG: M48 family metalloprotease [Pseudomonadales bacterium]